MKNLWQKEYTLRAGDFDKFDRIKPASVLDLFQDAAGQHAEEIGVGFNDMILRHYLWVLTRVKFEIVIAPKRYQAVVVKTWPLEPNRLNYRREYCIEDTNGNLLIKGSSEWVVLHSVERKLLSVPNLYSFTYGFHNEVMFTDKAKKVKDFEIYDNPYIVNASFSELDVNDHVNNTQYANYVMNAINPQKDTIIKTFQIDYRKEVMLGAQLKVYFIEEDDAIFTKAQNNDGDIIFACKISF